MIGKIFLEKNGKMAMNENKKKRTEDALECMNAVAAAVKLSQKWIAKYYPPVDNKFEQQSLDELNQHLEKSVMVTKNLSNSLLVDMELVPETAQPFVEEK